MIIQIGILGQKGNLFRSCEYSCQLGNISLQVHCLTSTFHFFFYQRNKKMFQLRRERPLLHGGCGDHAHHVNHIKNIKYESKWNQLSLIHFINVNLQQINSAITANDNFLPSLRAIQENIFLSSSQKQRMANIPQ